MLQIKSVEPTKMTQVNNTFKRILDLEAGLILSVSAVYMSPKILMPPMTIYLQTCRGRQKKSSRGQIMHQEE